MEQGLMGQGTQRVAECSVHYCLSQSEAHTHTHTFLTIRYSNIHVSTTET